MMIPHTLLNYVKAEPFRPFCLHMASGRTFEIRHPEMIKVLRSSALVFKDPGDSAELPERYDHVSLMLAESISHLEASAR